tara:strand:- start:459 stop:1370 length:912 start_codon:yes stop_codon:yes gene_type:complete
MAELPEFIDGQYGKLTAENLNSLIAQVKQNSSQIEAMGFGVQQQPRGGAGNFPIIAKLGPRVDSGEGEMLHGGDGNEDDTGPARVGYTWHEVMLEEAGTGADWVDANRRRYESDNPAFPTKDLSNSAAMLGEDEEEADPNEFVNMIVLLFPYGNAEGKSSLVFQAPKSQKTMPCVIVGDESECEPANGQPYRVQQMGINGPVGAEFFARNGCEREGDMGGSIANSSCNIDAPAVLVPKGKVVVCTNNGGGWWFNATNERCVTCCESDEGNAMIFEQNRESVTRTVSIPNYDPGFGSIQREMMR